MTSAWLNFMLLLLSSAVRADVTGETETETQTERQLETVVAEALVAEEHNNDTILSPAEELLQAAVAAGYDLTLQRLDIAAASTDEEVEEMMPPPVAEAFISHRRRDNVDLIREQMIGMIFTGRPQPLGSVPRRPIPRPMPPNFRSGPSGMIHVSVGTIMLVVEVELVVSSIAFRQY